MRRLGVAVLSLFAVIAIGIAVLVAVGSGSDSDGTSSSAAKNSGGVLRVGLQVRVSDLDSFRAGAESTVRALGLETLMQLQPDGTIKPWLAEKVSQPDELTFVYDLRKGVRFWNGSEMTSEDVANALNYYRRPKAVTSLYFQAVRSIDASGKYRVIVKLRRPDASWEDVAANPGTAIFEKKFQDKHGEKMGLPGVLIMGTGPWKFDSLDPTRGAELSANPQYWGPKPSFARISVKFFQDEAGMALAYRRGEIDVAPEVADPRGFAATSGAELRSVPQCWLEQFLMPTTTPPWDDVHVRRAVAYALNRDDLIAARGIEATPATTMVLPSQLQTLVPESEVSALVESLPSYPYDLERAKQELAASSQPNGFTFNFPTVKSYFGNDPQVVADQLKKIGINLKVANIPPSDWFNRLTTKRDIPSVTWAPCTSGDPVDFPRNYLGASAVNAADYQNPAVDKLLEESGATYDKAERFEAFGSLLKELATDVPYVPLFSQNAVAAIADTINWSDFSGNWRLRNWAMDIEPSAN